MSLWEFSSAVAGYARAQGEGDQPEAPSAAELDAAVLDYHINNTVH